MKKEKSLKERRMAIKSWDLCYSLYEVVNSMQVFIFTRVFQFVCLYHVIWHIWRI